MFCSTVVCQSLDAPAHGSKSCNEENMIAGAQCTFQCDTPLWQLESGSTDDVLTCVKMNIDGREEAVWDKPLPKCVRK